MKLFMKILSFSCCFVLIAMTSPFVSAQVNQERWAYEYSAGIGGIQSPFFGQNIDLPISSSWNEPRTNETHKGIDQAARGGTSVGPMYETARVLVNQSINGGGNTQTIRYYNFETGKTFYSIYMHLSAFVKSNNTVVYPSDETAKTGNSGLNCPNGCYHLHYELLDQLNVGTYSSAPYFAIQYDSRVGVNPFTHMTTYSADISDTTWKNFTVFSQPVVSGRKLTLRGKNSSSDGNNALTEVKIYFKEAGSTGYAVANMMKSGDGLWSYEFSNRIAYVDYFVIGRRNASERWASFPAKRYNLGSNGAGIIPSPNQCGCSYDTVRITF
jgi:murein DD-endopeptidase MepM/ murein hydrolase activator NlpD